MEDLQKEISNISLTVDTGNSVTLLDSGGDSTKKVVEGQAKNEAAVSDYFRPVFKEYCKKLGKSLEEVEKHSKEFVFDPKLLENLCYFTWGPDVFKSSHGLLKRCYNELALLFKTTESQSDLQDILQFFPSLAFATKFSQVVLAIALVDPPLVSQTFLELEKLWEEYQTTFQCHVETYGFMRGTLTELYGVLSGEDIGTEKWPKYEEISEMAKLTVKAYSVVFMKVFRTKGAERFERMQLVHRQDNATVEWAIYLVEMIRSKRREALNARCKRASPEELELVQFTLGVEPNNPYVRLNVIECVIDAVRENGGRFKTANENVFLQNVDEAMRFLQKESRSLLNDFPNNVHFNSVISDYFSRYVPYLYFDPPYAKALLEKAYKLNPTYGRTAHRFGIYYRMSEKNSQESLTWLQKSVELDPFHYNGNIDYFKTLLGRYPEVNDISDRMVEKITSKASNLWKSTEIAEFKFYAALAYFASNKKEEALKMMLDALKENEMVFTLSDVDLDSSIFNWNHRYINTEKLREWIQEENDKADNADDRRSQEISRMFCLMLGVVNPRAPPQYDGPYSQNFKSRLLKFDSEH